MNLLFELQFGEAYKSNPSPLKGERQIIFNKKSKHECEIMVIKYTLIDIYKYD